MDKLGMTLPTFIDEKIKSMFTVLANCRPYGDDVCDENINLIVIVDSTAKSIIKFLDRYIEDNASEKLCRRLADIGIIPE